MPDELERVASAVLRAIGVGRLDAAYMAQLIVASDLAGHESHGLRRLPEYVERWREGHADPGAKAVVEVDRGSLVRLDGRRAFGQLVLRDATDLAVERAQTHGIAAVAVHRAEPAGRYADFCERAAEAGVATLFLVNNAGGQQNVAPPGGREARLATNPIAAGIPRARSPHLVLDMATSAVAAGRLAEVLDRGEQPPDAWVNGDGQLRPLGGVKGFGLALVAEALAGALTGAGTVSAHPEHDDQGVLAVAIDVQGLRDLDDFTTEVERFIGYVRDVPLEPGAGEVRMPGETGARTAAARRAGGVPVQAFTWRRILRLCEEHGVQPPQVG